MSNTAEPVIDTTEMTCNTSMTDYCATTACDPSLATAEKDKRLCPASEMTCGDFDVIMKSDTGAMTNFYYQGGSLVAIEHVAASQHDCVAGPSSFVAQHCASTGHVLAACASEPPPSGW